MKYMGNLIAVADMEASKKFYSEVMGQSIISDFGANVTFTGGLSLQDLKWWADFIDAKEEDIQFGGKDAELYFEEDDFDGVVARLEQFDIKYVHRVKEHEWGQRTIRFYDPDAHIIEVGENMEMVLRRFLKQGMTAGQVAEKTMYPLEYVKKVQGGL